MVVHSGFFFLYLELLDQLIKACQRTILANTIARLHELVIDDISVQASSKRLLIHHLL